MSTDIGGLTTQIDARLPNGVSHAQKVNYFNTVIKKIYRDVPMESVYQFVASSSMLYDMSTNWRIDKTNRVLVSNATATTDITSTTLWEEYKYAGFDDELIENQYYTPNEHFQTTDAIVSSSQIGLYPESTELRVARVYYDRIPATIGTASSDSTTIPDIEEEYYELLLLGTLELVAKSGNAPDVELANNYYADYRDERKRVRMDKALRKERKRDFGWDWRDW